MFTRALLASACTLALAGSAAAADLPVTPPPVPVFTWTGVYFGGQIGYGWGNDNGNASYISVRSDRMAAANAVAPSATNPQGIVGGAHIGYNWQVTQWVLSLEGEVDGSGLNQSIPPLSYLYSTTDLFLQGALLGRVGYAFDHLLIYVTGGWTIEPSSTIATMSLAILAALPRPAAVGPSAAALNMPSTTIGRCVPNIVIRISAFSMIARSYTS